MARGFGLREPGTLNETRSSRSAQLRTALFAVVGLLFAFVVPVLPVPVGLLSLMVSRIGLSWITSWAAVVVCYDMIAATAAVGVALCWERRALASLGFANLSART